MDDVTAEQTAGTDLETGTSDVTEFTSQTWIPFPGLRIRATEVGEGYGVEAWRQRPDGSWAYAALRDQVQGDQRPAVWRVEA